eukprot:1873988-Amphidinium_carterae.1
MRCAQLPGPHPPDPRAEQAGVRFNGDCDAGDAGADACDAGADARRGVCNENVDCASSSACKVWANAG